jgi:hypothetical protein
MATLIDIDPVHQLANAERDLVAEFPREMQSEIHTMVGAENARYRDAKIREYVSILVARAVRGALRRRGAFSTRTSALAPD